jgi:periplasmic divalent cation tolerance protein
VPDPSGVVLVTVTVPDEATGARLAAALVERRLAACVKVAGPVSSTYRWREVIATDQEWVLSIVTLRSAFDGVAVAVAELHPYEVPEVVATEVVAATNAYGQWVREQVSAAADTPGSG